MTLSARKKWPLWLLLICLLFVAPRAQALELFAQEGENEGGTVYELRTETGETLTHRAGRIYEGDEYISSDNQLYRVIAVDDALCIATARHMGAEPAAGASASAGDAALAAESADGDGEKRVAMYSTHSDESYEPSDGAASLEEDAGIFDVGEALQENLEALGISVEYSKDTFLPHDAGAYSRSRRTAEELLQGNPDMLIDIHRDGIPDPEEYETEVHGEEMSKVRLLVGRSNPNAAANREFAKELKAAADEMYPGLIKDIFIGKGNYNQELYPQSILLEFGTHTLEKEKAISATELMANVINEVVFGGSAKAEEAAGARSGAGFSGLWWLIAVAVLGAGVYALVSTGKWRLIGEKFSRSASELTGGCLGKKPEDEKGSEEKKP